MSSSCCTCLCDHCLFAGSLLWLSLVLRAVGSTVEVASLVMLSLPETALVLFVNFIPLVL